MDRKNEIKAMVLNYSTAALQRLNAQLELIERLETGVLFTSREIAELRATAIVQLLDNPGAAMIVLEAAQEAPV